MRTFYDLLVEVQNIAEAKEVREAFNLNRAQKSKAQDQAANESGKRN